MLMDSIKDSAADRVILPRVAMSGQPSGEHQWLRDWTVLLCVQNNEETGFLARWVRDRGGLPVRVGACRDMARFFTDSDPFPSMIILEVSDNADMSDVIDRCLELRKVAPGSPIILISRNFSYNDFSTSRLEICDASLRIPILRSAFEDVVLLAMTNNAQYCERKGKAQSFDLATVVQHMTEGVAEPVEDHERLKRSGWWIIPFMLLGLGFWASLLVLLFW